MRRPFAALCLVLAAFLGAATASTVDAQPRKAAAKKPPKGKKGAAEAEDKTPGEAVAAESKSATEQAEEGEGRVVGGDGGAPKKKGGGPTVVEEKSEGDAGVKTYKFGPVEVEGRLKSPQVVYFMRRVRAEFAAGELGHRSFMRELSDTRRHPALK